MPLEAIIGVSYNQSISEILNFPVHSPVISSFQFNSGIVSMAKLEINLIPSFEVLISAGVNLEFFYQYSDSQDDISIGEMIHFDHSWFCRS